MSERTPKWVADALTDAAVRNRCELPLRRLVGALENYGEKKLPRYVRVEIADARQALAALAKES